MEYKIHFTVYDQRKDVNSNLQTLKHKLNQLGARQLSRHIGLLR